MTRLEVPLLDRILLTTGDRLLRAEITLLLKDARGVWTAALFRVDSATDMTTMPAFEAKRLDLPMPRRAVAGLTHQPTGLEIRSGFLRAQVLGMDGTEYAFPRYYLGDPNTAPPATGSKAPQNLLGLTGVVDKIRLIFDGTPTSGAPYGNLIVEKI
jgi:hypothetical protein